MSTSESETEEFFDAQEFTPNKSKRTSLSQSTSVDKTTEASNKRTAEVEPTSVTITAPLSQEDDNTIVKNVVQGRNKFRELRAYMQTEDDEQAGYNSTPDSRSDSAEGVFAAPKHKHPFKIIDRDAMSLQSMTSLGRIGRILSGTSDNIGNIKENVPAPSPVSREPSTLSDEQMPPPSTVLAEPDVIASTKANSLKGNRSTQGVTTMSTTTQMVSGPVAPPRRKKRGKLHGSQTLSMTDGDNLSVSTVDDDFRIMQDRTTHLQHLVLEPTLSSMIQHTQQSQALPCPTAGTIESLTRDFRDSILKDGSEQMSKPGPKHKSSLSERGERSSAERLTRSGSSSRSSTGVSVRSHHSTNTLASNAHSLDIRSAVKGQYVVKPSDEDKLKCGGGVSAGGGGGRTQSEERAPGCVGHSSLGSQHRWRGDESDSASSRSRRRSAGDSDALAKRVDRELEQLNMKLRTRTDSGERLSDMQILEQVTVLNLDTGERVPLSVAEHKLPQCINPLSLHIMRLTSEYCSTRSHEDDHARETDEESEGTYAGAEGTMVAVGDKREATPPDEQQPNSIRRKTDKLKRFFGTTVKKTMDAAKSLAAEVSHARHKEYVADIVDDVHGEHNIKLRASNSHKGPYDFDTGVRHVQEMSTGHTGAVWCMKFSVCGRLLATAGQDRLLRIWVLREDAAFFQDMRTKYAKQKSSPTPSQESLASLSAPPPSPEEPPLGPMAPFLPKPWIYSGHTSDLLDLSWSKNYFILSSSMDKTVRLWHISRTECLCCFQHIDFVTAIVFHPRDDRYFLSGSLDGKLRLWNIPDKKVAVWNEVDGQTKLITAANFCQNGKFAVVGTYDGRCIFYTTDQLKYHTQIDVRSTRGKNSTGRKISGIEPMPNDDKILVTSNDSRIRLYDLRDLNLSCKYKGYVNISSQIKASFSHDGKYIVSGSENQCIYIWKTHHDYSKFTSVRRDRNDFWEGIKAHNAVVTCAVFAPNPDDVIRMIEERERKAKHQQGTDHDEEAGSSPARGNTPARSHCAGHVLVSADFNGSIKVFVSKSKPKHSSLPASALV